MERWKPVVGYEGIYEVSDFGNVRSLDRVMTYPSGRTYRWEGKVLSPGKTGDRLTVALGNGTAKSHYVHELVLTAFIGPCPPDEEGCHNNGNGTYNALTNLRWDTRSENTFDRVRHGTHHAKNREACPWGHLLVMPNLIHGLWEQYGRRNCLTCACARSNQQYALKHGRAFDWNLEIAYQYSRILGLNNAPNPHQRKICAFGHLLQKPNIRAGRSGTCLACNRASGNKSTAKKLGKPFDFKEAANRHYWKIMMTQEAA